MWGKKHSLETRMKISLAHKKSGHKPPSFRGKKHSEKSKIKIGIKQLGNQYAEGNIMSKESRLKMSIMRKGQKHWWGDKISLSLKQLFQNPENCPNWRGGLSFEPYSVNWTEKLRKTIRERDAYICKLCGKYGNTVHHIDYNKKNCNPDNLITLCNNCNLRVNFNRENWINHFQYV